MEHAGILVLAILFHISAGTDDCSKHGEAGKKTPEDYADIVDIRKGPPFEPPFHNEVTAERHSLLEGQAVIIREADYIIGCCGTISGWKFYIKNPGHLYLQVWRSLGTGEFELVGENWATYNQGEEDRVYTLNVPMDQRISVNTGDYIGWYSEEEPMISYKKNKKSAGSLIQTMKNKPDVGDVIDWYRVPASDGRLYGLYVTLEKNNSPKITNLQDDVTIETSVNPGDIIYTLGVRDEDRDDVSSLEVTMDSYSEYFVLGNDSRSVLVKKTPFEGHYTLSFSAKDHCRDSASGNLKITVKTKVPFILNLPRGMNVREDVTNEVLLHELDVLAKGPYACNVKHIEPKPKRTPFLARYINTTNSWGVFLKANALLNYEDEGNYIVTVECGEGKSTDSKDLVVSIIPNSAPRYLNLPGTVEVSAKLGVVGEVVYHVNAEDNEKDPLIFDMSCDPDPCPFNITKGGSVILVDSLVDKGAQKYYLDVIVNDRYTKVGPGVLVINVTDINHPPYIYNIHLHDSVKHYAMESLPIGSEVFKVIATDIDVNDSIEFSMTIKPPELTGFFDIDMYTGSIKTAAMLDYEANKKNTISMYVSATDGKVTTTQKLKVYITDVNEPPDFIYPAYVVHTTEIDPKGKDDFHLKLPSLQATDLDKDDKVRYSLDCGDDNSYFFIDAKKGEITQTAEYDVDILNEPFHEIYCLVTATDIRGLESVANLTIIVDDINDHAPAFERTRYLFVTTRDMPLFSVIGQTFAHDADTAPPNNKLWYNIKSTTAPVTIDDNGTVYLVQDLSNVQLGTLYQFSIEVIDGGNRSQIETVIIVVLAGNYSTLTSALRAEEFSFLTLPENMVWFVTASYLLLLLFSLVLYLLGRTSSCTIRPRNQRSVRNISTPRQFISDGEGVREGTIDGRRSARDVVAPKLCDSLLSTESLEQKNEFRKRPSKVSIKDKLPSYKKNNMSFFKNSNDQQSGETSTEKWIVHDLENTNFTQDSVWPSADVISPGPDSRCSLSDINPAYKLPWKPWSVTDFKERITPNSELTMKSDKTYDSNSNATGRKPSTSNYNMAF